MHRACTEWVRSQGACRRADHLRRRRAGGARQPTARNGIGTVLAADHAFQVFAFEHFNERHHQWICSGAPVRDQVSGQTIGLIDLSSLWKIASPRSLESRSRHSRTIDQCLTDARRNKCTSAETPLQRFHDREHQICSWTARATCSTGPSWRSRPMSPSEGGGEVVVGDGSVTEAAPLGEIGLPSPPGHHSQRQVCPTVKVRRTKNMLEKARRRARLGRRILRPHQILPDQLFGVVAEQVTRSSMSPHVQLAHSRRTARS